MSRFFLDSSAIVKYYNTEEHSDKVRYLIDERLEKTPAFYIPNVAILETVSAFYRAHYIDGKINLDLAKELVATFLNDSDKGRFFIYSLKQQLINSALDYFVHVYDIQRVVQEMRPERETHQCSAIDILIVSMAQADMQKNGKDIFLLTNDKQQHMLAERLGVNTILLSMFGLDSFKKKFPLKPKKTGAVISKK